MIGEQRIRDNAFAAVKIFTGMTRLDGGRCRFKFLSVDAAIEDFQESETNRGLARLMIA